jgi:hypothetical protein
MFLEVKTYLYSLALAIASLLGAVHANALPDHDIIFVTQIPIPNDFVSVNATFGNHLGGVTDRGFGDLYIRYTDGSVRNLTQAAGYGNEGFQGANSIAVRDPAVHWSGNKVIFSMITGAPTARYQVAHFYWQLYEITNFAQGQTPVITKVPNQPGNFNNVMPVYASDGETIFFVSDRPRNGAQHLYPQRDEYESAPSNTGIWKLTPSDGSLTLLDHSPSGDFHPFIDSFGRIIFTRWDHLQQDQQADNEAGADKGYGAFNYADESATAARLNNHLEYFPEHEDPEAQAEADPNVYEHRFNQFFPWAVNQDGTDLETINHIGRHELSGYINKTFKNDPALEEFYGQYNRFNQKSIGNFLHIKEDPTHPGRYFGIDCPEFGTHASGQIISLEAPPSLIASQIAVTYVTNKATASTSNNPPPEHVGLFRNPLPMSDGTLIAAHTSATQQDSNIGTSTAPQSKYDFRIKTLVPAGSGDYVPGSLLTPGITKNVTYWSPDESFSYNGQVWELQPVEVMARTAPAPSQSSLKSPELSVFSGLGVDPSEIKSLLAANNLALIVGRDVTTRDALDLQQPYNLAVDGGTAKTIGNNGKLYLLRHLQIFQGDQIRGYGSSFNSGRRVLAVPMHDLSSVNLPSSDAPAGAVPIYADGSYAAVVPARRALSWQLTDREHAAVVRERYWLTFQPGEIRVCTSCHGITTSDQAGKPEPTNPPQALGEIIRYLKNLPPSVFPPAEGTPPSSTKYSLKISAAKLSNKRHLITKINISTSPAAPGKQITVSVASSNLTCGKGTKTITLDGHGKRSVTVGSPTVKKNTSASINLKVNNAVVKKSTLRLKPLRGQIFKSFGKSLCNGVSIR